MRYRTINDKILVSEIGFGGIALLKGGLDIMPPHYNLSVRESTQLLHEAFDWGITLYDTAIADEYGDSEYKIAHAFQSRRQNVFLSTKARCYTYKAMRAAINGSLENMKTDYIDFYGIHQIRPSNIEQCFDPENGCLRALSEAQKQGKIRFITIGTHYAQTAADCSKDERIDMVQLPHNPLEFGLYNTAIERGLIVRKTFFHKILGAGVLTDFMPLEYLIHYSLKKQPVFVGIGTPLQMKELKKAYESCDKESPEFVLPFSECNRCQKCQCTQGYDIASILRLRAFSYLGFHRWAKAMYKKKTKSPCIKCGSCVKTCPRNVRIPELIEEFDCWIRELDEYKETAG